MIEIREITKRYGEQLLFDEAVFNVLQGEKIGLIGRNGHGKSTLLKMVIGEEEPDQGGIVIPKNYKIGYLHQFMDLTEKNVLDEACKGLPLGEEAETWKAKKILMGLGFSNEDLEKSPDIFSGGFQMRIELAKVLVSDPHMLLLDEPTNFLDIVSIRWIEKFLRSWKREFIIISHDRSFMDNVVTHIVGINRAKTRKIKGGTSTYYSFISGEEEIHEKRRVNEQKKRKQIEGYISSFRAKARRARSVQSSIKMLDKMENLDKLDNIQTLGFSFKQADFRPPVVMEAKGICFSYEKNMPYLIDNFDLIVERGDKICIAGANGKGKTTLAKILAGTLKPLKGGIKRNPQVRMSYYEQGNTAKLHDTNTIEEEILFSYPGKNKTEVRSVCGAMMFSGDSALKKISVLSGGERSRVLLAKTLLFSSNLLILDEPTHHLDMESCSALFEAVKEYEGAAIVVTHDEYFLHKAATKLIIFTDNRVMVFPGNYSEFLEQIGWNGGALSQGKKRSPGTLKNQEVSKSSINKKEKRRLRAQQSALRREKLEPLKTKIKTTEKNIASSEQRHNILTEELIKASEKKDGGTIQEASKELTVLKLKTEHLYEELGRLLQKYEEVKKELEDTE
ncbi:MAG: ATP-binding cassette domain-containing protein [Candidatus Omnitrophota bacterium]